MDKGTVTSAEMTANAPLVLVVDDHAVVRSGCRQLLEPPMSRFRVVEASDGPSARAELSRHDPDIIVADLNMPGTPSGLDLLRELTGEGRRVVVLTMHETPSVAARCLELGAAAYVTKSDAPDALIEAVETVARGGRWLSADLARDLAMSPRQPDLSEREADIMDILAQTADLEEVGRQLGISYKTVANTLVRLRNRYGVRRTADLVRVALQRRQGL